VLSFAHVGMQLDGFAVAAMEGFVLVEHDLDGVFAGGNVFEAADGIAVCGGVNDSWGGGLPAVDIEAEDHLGARRVVDLIAGLVAGVGGEQEKEPSVEGLRAEFFGEGDGEGLRGDGRRDGEANEKPKTKSKASAHDGQYTGRWWETMVIFPV